MSKSMNVGEDWDSVITPKRQLVNLNFSELWKYRDLLMLFVKRDIVTVYKQTILGPIWFIIQPLLTSFMFVVIFSRMANFGTDEVPPLLFYIGSQTLWNYFSETLNLTSKTFSDNASVFGKVYFPRLILPLSKIISGLIKFFIQLMLFIIILIYYVFVNNRVHPNMYLMLFPILVAMAALLSFSMGIIITAMTTKYRDMTFLVAFGVNLMFYVTPVIYPVSRSKQLGQWLWLNPLTSVFEAFKYGFFGKGTFSWAWLGYSAVFTIVTMLLGIIVFNNVERKFIDTV